MFRFLQYGNILLRHRCLAVKELSPRVKEITENMLEVGRVTDCYGIASPQMGKCLEIVYLNTELLELDSDLEVLYNLDVRFIGGKVKEIEGCLSLPNKVEVSRSETICVSARNLLFKKVEFECSGLLSRVIQHEFDHLRGILIIDY